MAYTPFLVLQTISGGSDQTAPGPNGGNGGGFDPGYYTGMATDGTAISANTATPIFSSNSYAFKSTDIGAWLYIANGANWIPGWYNITSVATSAATVNASTSGATLSGGNLSSINGFATIANPSGAIWSVDYSQQPLSQITFTDLTITSSSSAAATSLLNPFAINHVGNIVCISAGTGFTLQRSVITSISASSIAVFDRILGNINSSGGKGALGGAYGSPGAPSLIYVPGVRHFIKRANYVLTSAAQAPGGRLLTGNGPTLSQPAWVRGYDVVPGDETALINRPKLIGGISIGSSFISIQNAGIVENLILDGRMQTFANNRGIAVASAEARIRRCLFKNFDFNAIQNTGSTSDLLLIDCEITSCSGQAAFTTIGTSQNTFINCHVHDNLADGVTFTTAAPGRLTAINTIFANNKLGATKSHVVFTLDAHAKFINCVFYGAGSHAIDAQVLSHVNVFNSIFENNGGWGVNSAISAANPGILLYNNGWFNNTLGNYDTGKIFKIQVMNDILSTGTFFNNARDGNYSLNNTVSQGKLARAAGYPVNIVNIPTFQFLDVGAAQHLDSDGNTGYSIGGVF